MKYSKKYSKLVLNKYHLCLFLLILPFLCVCAGEDKEIKAESKAERTEINAESKAERTEINAESKAESTESKVESKAESRKREKTEVVALKNNVLYDAMLTPNLQLEVRLAPRWTIEFGAGFNPFPLDDTKFPKWRHVSATVQPKYWFCGAFAKGFIGFNASYAHYNVAGGSFPLGWIYSAVKDGRYQGDAVMAGASFGWHFPISPHFGIELEIGADGGYTWYDRYECKHCGTKTGSEGRWFGIPKAGVNLVVPLGGDKESLARRCPCEEMDREELLPAQPVIWSLAVEPAVLPGGPAKPGVSVYRAEEEKMEKLRSRLIRSEKEFEPYDVNTALSADPRNVFLYFDVNVTKMDRSFIQNDLLMDSIMQILGEAMADSTMYVSHVRIVGFASFDGRMANNIRLAGNRAGTIKEYIQSVYPLDDSRFDVCNGGESWSELKYQLAFVEFEGRDEVLAIIDREPDPDRREAQIKKLHGGATYRYMRDELKHILRNLGCITIYCEFEDEDN